MYHPSSVAFSGDFVVKKAAWPAAYTHLRHHFVALKTGPAQHFANYGETKRIFFQIHGSLELRQ